MNINPITFGLNKLLNFKNLNFNLWQNAGLHIITPQYIDYEMEAVHNFVRTYREKYNDEPSEFAFSGYEHLFYFSQILSKYDGDMEYIDDFAAVKILSAQFKFEPKSEANGHQNSHLFILKAEDSKLTIVE